MLSLSQKTRASSIPGIPHIEGWGARIGRRPGTSMPGMLLSIFAPRKPHPGQPPTSKASPTLHHQRRGRRCSLCILSLPYHPPSSGPLFGVQVPVPLLRILEDHHPSPLLAAPTEWMGMGGKGMQFWSLFSGYRAKSICLGRESFWGVRVQQPPQSHEGP